MTLELLNGESFGTKGWRKKAWKMPIIGYLTSIIDLLPNNPKNSESLGKVRAVCHLLKVEPHYQQKASYLLAPLRELTARVPLLPRTTSFSMDENYLIAEELHAIIKHYQVP